MREIHLGGIVYAPKAGSGAGRHAHTVLSGDAHPARLPDIRQAIGAQSTLHTGTSQNHGVNRPAVVRKRAEQQVR